MHTKLPIKLGGFGFLIVLEADPLGSASLAFHDVDREPERAAVTAEANGRRARRACARERQPKARHDHSSGGRLGW
jgi:hypothetical protein